jgi:DHA1 family tetracycline resistance protein-like MFS transporter
MAEPSSARKAGPTKHGKNAFLFIIVTVAIDMMGFGVIMPSMPSLLSGLTGLPIADVTPWGGYITTVFAVMNFFASPILGNLSDRFGRRPVLLVSLGTLCIDFLIMGFAQTIWVLFIGRILSGASAATQSTASAYIADVTEPKERAQAFGMLGAAFGLGFILGPALGGFLGEQLGPRAPFFASAGLCAVNFLYGLFVLPESLAPENRRKFDWKRANAIGAFRHFAKLPHLAWFMAAVGLYQFAHWVYPATFNYYAPVRYGWGQDMIGLALAGVGVGSAVVQGLLVGRFIKWFGATRTALIGFILSIIAFILYAGAVRGWMAFAIMPVTALGGVLGPAMNQIMSARVARNAQGEMQGAMASVQALTNMTSPLVMTQTFFYFTHSEAPVHFAGASFVLAAVVASLSLIPLVIGLRTVPKVAETGGPPPDPAPDAEAESAGVTAEGAAVVAP